MPGKWGLCRVLRRLKLCACCPIMLDFMEPTIGLVLKPGAKEALEALAVVQHEVPKARLLVEKEGHHALDPVPKGVEPVDNWAFETTSDMVLVLGGDGTLIHAAALLQKRLVPILGVNLGRIGFLTDVTREELTEILPLALQGALPFLDRQRLDLEVWRGEHCLAKGRVLNDAVVHPAGLARIARYKITCGGTLVTTLRSDGVIVSTPTGSTAYSMAAGGSILAPGLQAIAITPICPQALTQRPLVVASTDEIRISLESDNDVFVSFDGQSGVEMQKDDVMKAQIAPLGVRLYASPKRDYFRTLREKLGWGEV